MSARWRMEGGSFEVVNGTGIVEWLFGGFLFLNSCFFLYHLGTGIATVIRTGSWDYAVSSAVGILFLLIMAGLTGGPAVWLTFRTTRTTFHEGTGLASYAVPLLGLAKTIHISEIRRVVVNNYREARPNKFPPHTVDILPNWQKVEIASFRFSEKKSALELGRQLAGFLNVEFVEEDLDVSKRGNAFNDWALAKERWGTKKKE